MREKLIPAIASVIGRAKYSSAMVGTNTSSVYVGAEAVAKSGVVKTLHPIQHGLITDWSDMERIWEHTFTNVLRAEPSEHNVLLTEPPLNPKTNREKIV